ncbi:hypothetical protein [Glaciihabitans sp. UYNi722]|uniref:hypothetical protein n=1 Tax=Glaciihabitans sp. UYNi722 TaxID=3156344 RepID=UPI00339A5E81
MSTRWARLTRGLLAALFSTFVAACSHTLSGRSIPSLVGLALCLAFSTVLCTLLAGKTLSLLRLSISIGVSQFAFHGAFSLLADAAPSSIPMPGMHDHSAGAMSLHLNQVSPGAHAAMSADPGMWLGHAVAAAITIVAFRFGEAAFWELLELTLLRITRLALYAHRVQPVASLRPSVVAAERAQIPRPVDHVLSALRHRGPPAVVMA